MRCGCYGTGETVDAAASQLHYRCQNQVRRHFVFFTADFVWILAFGKGEEMQTVFSHIVQKRLSEQNENVATEALAFILRSHKAAQKGMLKLLRGIDPKMPPLWF